jgi:hypothetical protein
MSDLTEIPEGEFEGPAPCWIRVVDTTGKPIKPIIKCKCGVWCDIGRHHVHADGTVTASFYHREDLPGCGWHVFLRLKDYNLGEFPPRPIE